MLPTPNESTIHANVVSFLGAILPGLEVISAYDNRVPEPSAPDFAIISTTARRPMCTPVEAWCDVAFTGIVSGNTLTASNFHFGLIDLSNGNQPPCWGVGVVDGTPTLSQTSGTPGGAGVYALGGAPQTAGPVLMAAGEIVIVQPTEVTLQLDFHSNVGDGADQAQAFATMFRTLQAGDLFRSYANNVGILFCEDPRLIPFVNAEQEWEQRWVVLAHLQANQAIPWPQQFFSAMTVTFIDASQL